MDRREWVDRLFQEHGDALFRYLRSFRLPEDETYDLVQSVFLKLIEVKPTKLKQPKAWLFAVGRNMAINALGRAKRTSAVPESFEPPGDEPSPLDRLLEGEAYARLWQAFSQLPERDREMIRLSLEHGLTHEQIAEVTGTTRGAVKVAMHRNRHKLRELVGRQEEAPPVRNDRFENKMRSAP